MPRVVFLDGEKIKTKTFLLWFLWVAIRSLLSIKQSVAKEETQLTMFVGTENMIHRVVLA